MKKFFAILGIILLGTMIASPVLAASNCTSYCNDPANKSAPTNKFCICNPLNATSVTALIDRLVNFIFLVGVAVAPVMILVGAFYYMTSAGDPDKVGKAKQIILYTLLGVAILYMANILISMVRNILGVS